MNACRSLFVTLALLVAATPALAQEPRLLAGHEGGCLTLAFSGDGKRLATGGADRKVRLWDTGTGKELAALESAAPVSRVAFSADGKTLALVNGTEILVLDAATAKTVTRFASPACALAFSQDGKRLFSGGADGAVSIHDCTSWKVERTLAPEDGGTPASRAIASLYLAADGRLIAFSGSGLSCWDVASGKRLPSITRAGTAFDRAVLSPDGAFLMAPSESGILAFRTVDMKSDPRTLGSGLSQALAFSPDSKIVAGARGDRTVLWDLETGTSLRELTAFAGDVLQVLAFSPDGTIVAGAGKRGEVRLWDAGNKQDDAGTVVTALMKKAASHLRDRLARNEGEKGRARAVLGPFVNQTSSHVDMASGIDAVKNAFARSEKLEVVVDEPAKETEGEEAPKAKHGRTSYLIVASANEIQAEKIHSFSVTLELLSVRDRTCEVVVFEEALLVAHRMVSIDTDEGRKLEAELEGNLGPVEARAVAADLAAAIAKFEFPAKAKGLPEITFNAIRNQTDRHLNTELLTDRLRAAVAGSVVLTAPPARLAELKKLELQEDEDDAVPQRKRGGTRYALAGKVTGSTAAYKIVLELSDMQTRAVVLTVEKSFSK